MADTVKKDLDLLEQVFCSMDSNGDGKVEYHEFEAFYMKSGLNVPAASIRAFFNEMDKNKDGNVDVGELMDQLPLYVFYFVCEVVLSFLQSSAKTKELYQAFVNIDENHDGSISFAELKTMMQKRGEHMSESELKQLMEAADTNGDGVVSFIEFARVILEA